MINERQTLTSRQFAEAMGVSESSVKRWVDEGEIVAHRTAGGHRRIPMAAAVRFIRLQRARPAKPHLLSLPTMPVFGDIDADAADGLHQALLRDDAPQARAIISGRFLAGAEIAAIGDGLIRPALQRIGELWQSDPEGILLEHRAVESCVQILSEIMLWLPTPAPDAPAAIAAAGPGDPYMLPPMLAFLALRERGLRAVNLGPLTPLATVTQAVNRYGTRVCSLSMSNPYSAGRGSNGRRCWMRRTPPDVGSWSGDVAANLCRLRFALACTWPDRCRSWRPTSQGSFKARRRRRSRVPGAGRESEHEPRDQRRSGPRQRLGHRSSSDP